MRSEAGHPYLGSAPGGGAGEGEKVNPPALPEVVEYPPLLGLTLAGYLILPVLPSKTEYLTLTLALPPPSAGNLALAAPSTEYLLLPRIA